MRPVRVNRQLAAAVADGIAQAQAVGGSGNLALNGSFVTDGIAYLDSSRRVIITSAGDDTGITFTIYGTNQGQQIQQTIAGANAGIAVTTIDFDTVTRIAASAAAAGNVSAGTNGVGGGPLIRTDYHLQTDISVEVKITGTANVTVFVTYDDMSQDPSIPKTFYPITGLTTITANTVAVINDPITAVYPVINSGDGLVEVTMIQGGLPQSRP